MCASSEQVMSACWKIAIFLSSFCHSAPCWTCFGVCSSAGSVPATSFLKQSGIHLDSKGFITVNKVLEENMICHICEPLSSSELGPDLQMMQTNVDGVFAGGDVVMFPFPQRNNKKVNIPHWQMAHVHGECSTASGCRWEAGMWRAQREINLSHLFSCWPTGRVAALSMMGRTTEIKTVPYFWSAMFGKTIRYAGWEDLCFCLWLKSLQWK